MQAEGEAWVVTELDDSLAEAHPPSAAVQPRLSPSDRRSRALSRTRKRLGILGVPVDNVSLDEALGIIERYVARGGFHQIATANVDFLIKAIHDDGLMDILHRCSMVLPDGMPIVWTSRLLRQPLQERVTGADLVPRLAELAARKSYGLYLLGAEEERSAAAAAQITKAYPLARIVGRHSPPFAALEDMDHEEILRDIERTRPDILLVAFGNPKQEKWIAMHRHRLAVPVCVGVGASLDFLSGMQHRAPSGMQGFGLEWLHRLYREPRRLAPRYLGNALGLVRYLSPQLLTMCTQRRANPSFTLSHRWVDHRSVLTLTGTFSGEVVTDLVRLLHSTNTPSGPVMLEVSGVQHIGLDALGTLISLGDRMRTEGRELWLVGARPTLRRVFRDAILDTRFHFAPTLADAALRLESADPRASQTSSKTSVNLHLPQSLPTEAR